MLETAYIVAKLLVSIIFVVISGVLLFLCFMADRLKQEFLKLEEKIKQDLYTAYNVGTAAITLILTFLFSGPGVKTPFWFSVLSYTGVAKYKDLYSPLKSLWQSSKDLSHRIKELIR